MNYHYNLGSTALTGVLSVVDAILDAGLLFSCYMSVVVSPPFNRFIYRKKTLMKYCILYILTFKNNKSQSAPISFQWYSDYL